MNRRISFGALFLGLVAMGTGARAVTTGLPSTIVDDGVGLNIHGSWSGDVDMAKAAGTSIVRVDLYWSGIEQTQGVYDFSNFDSYANYCNAKGVRVLWCLDGSSSYYTANTAAWRTGFANLAAAAAAHYQGSSNLFEFYNEPDGSTDTGLSNASTYMSLVEQAVPAMRTADPSCTIIGPAVAITSTSYSEDLHSRRIAQLCGCRERASLSIDRTRDSRDRLCLRSVADADVRPQNVANRVFGMGLYHGNDG